MRRNIILPIVLLMSVALVAGCVGQSAIDSNIFGSDVIKTTRTTTSTGVTEPVVLQNVRSLPDTTVVPEQPLRLLMNIVSQDNDPTTTIKNVYIDLFDANMFNNSADSAETSRCNTNPIACYASKCNVTNKCELHLGEIIPIEFDLKAPSVNDIANIITKATLSWLMRYDYATTTSYDVLVVSRSEVERLQQEGQSLTVPVQDMRGPGPIKIELSANPAFSLSGQDIYLTVKLTNVGSGFTENRTIAEKGIGIYIPSGISVKQANDYFTTCVGDGTTEVTCSNDKPIEFFKKETTPIQFILHTTAAVTAPHRTFTMTAYLYYTYELRGSTVIEIRPQQFG